MTDIRNTQQRVSPRYGDNFDKIERRKVTLVLCWGISHYEYILKTHALNNPIYIEKASSVQDHSPDNAALHVDATFWDLATDTKKGIIDRLISNGFDGAEWAEKIARPSKQWVIL